MEGGKSSSKLSFASVMGFRPKKSPQLPALATKNPLPAPYSTPPTYSPSLPSKKYANRPPSNSVSSTIRSGEDSSGPKTPSDTHRSRQSLLTLSDADPFAATTLPTSSKGYDHNRLSVYSSNSASDSLPGKSSSSDKFNRSSFASISSNSHNPTSPLSPPMPPRLKSSEAYMRSVRKTSSFSAEPVDQVVPTSMDSFVSPSSNSSTDKNRLSQPGPSLAPRPPMRARGMTDAGTSAGTTLQQFLREDPPSYFTSHVPPSKPSRPPPVSSSNKAPRVVIRQASLIRNGLTLPTSNPPNLSLPTPPPQTLLSAHTDKSDMMLDSPASTSSSISFASSGSVGPLDPSPGTRNRRRKLPQTMEGRVERDLLSRSTDQLSLAEALGIHAPPSWIPDSPSTSRVPLQTSPSSSKSVRTLKKAASSNSLSKRNAAEGNRNYGTLPSSSQRPPTSPLYDRDALRKQRSFHHPRAPLPNVPLPHLPSALSSPIERQRAELPMTPPTSNRRRLFSGGSNRRPSTGNSYLPDEDNQSLFSSPRDDMSTINHTLSPAQSIINLPPSYFPGSTSSLWTDDQQFDYNTRPGSPTHASPEYTPKQILSPDEMLKIEANLHTEQEQNNNSGYVRSRGLSITSTSSNAPSWWEREREKRDLERQQQHLDFHSLDPGLHSPQMGSRGGRDNELFDDRSRSGSADVSTSIMRSNSMIGSSKGMSDLALSPSNSMRPSTSSGMPNTFQTSLPPPPRPRPTHSHSHNSKSASNTNRSAPNSRPSTATNSVSRTASVTSHDTMATMRTSSSGHSSRSTLTSASATTIPRKSSRTKFSEEFAKKRQSLMRKPSFLEIEDDDDPPPIPLPEKTRLASTAESRDINGESSFLNFRDSFDTVRDEED